MLITFDSNLYCKKIFFPQFTELTHRQSDDYTRRIYFPFFPFFSFIFDNFINLEHGIFLPFLLFLKLFDVLSKESDNEHNTMLSHESKSEGGGGEGLNGEKSVTNMHGKLMLPKIYGEIELLTLFLFFFQPK